MDLNYILIWMVAASTVIQGVVVRTQERALLGVWWRMLMVVGVTLAVGLLFVPDRAGIIATPVWLVLVVLPMILQVVVKRSLSDGKLARAGLAATVLAKLLPAPALVGLSIRLRVFAAAEARDYAKAEKLLVAATSGKSDPRVAAWAAAMLPALRRDWVGLLDKVEQSHGKLLAIPDVASRVIQAFGELGRHGEMLATHRVTTNRQAPVASRLRDLLTLATYLGRPELVDRIVGAPTSKIPDDMARFARASALQSAGRYDEAGPLLRDLSQGDDPRLADMAAERLESPLEMAPNDSVSLLVIGDVGHQVDALVGIKPAKQKPAWATRITFAILAIVFIIEVPGGSEDPENLYNLGMLVLPLELTDYGYWRFLTATFLHFGVLHFALNAVALLIFGSNVERLWGPWRFVAVYMASNLIGMIAVASWVEASLQEPQMIVGASGGVMGLLGAITAVILLRWRANPSKVNRSRLLILLFVLAIQITFDASTPVVSGTAHLGGLATGFALGLWFGKRKGLWAQLSAPVRRTA